ncbi:acyl-CoA dehydrogenase, partial [Dactylosporangium sp. NPDC005572]|uniref:acyl-CoA dehydrogenase n=1 Tax=Dactylosporangium sp. NPDC005572 TaxID=3156889 RepID=UPI0033B7BD47
HLDEQYGGQGGGIDHLAAVIEEFAYALLPGPFVPTVLASAAVAAADVSPVRDGLLVQFVEGATGALAARGFVAVRSRDGWVLSGSSGPIIGLASADIAVIVADADDGHMLFAVPVGQLAVTVVPSTDLTRDVAMLDVDGFAVPIGSVLYGSSSSRLGALEAAVWGAEAAGIMRWSVDASVGYAKIRNQFGVPIGSFQAIKHKCARMLVTSELATAAAWGAAASLAQSEAQQQLAALAVSATLDDAIDLVTEAVTIFGGIGFTWEHDAHLYWRRAIAISGATGGVAPARGGLGGAALVESRAIEVEPEGDLGEFRARTGGLLDAALELPCGAEGPKGHHDDERRWFLAANGLVSPHWPAPFGLGASPAEQIVIAEEYARRGMPQPTTIIGEWAVPTILAFGTDAQKERFAAATLRGEIEWCQLFSEPSAGSDLAGVATKAVKVDGGWQLNGQKVWTSSAHEADWAICLARTDSTVPKHKGLSYFLVDMSSAGVDVRPLRQSTGEAHFSEVFLDAVFVPDDCLVGEPGQGWRITTATLQNERTAIGSGFGSGPEAPIRDLVAAGEYVGDRQAALGELGVLIARGIALLGMNTRSTLRRLGGAVDATSSLAKVASAKLARDAALAGVRLAGPAAAVTPEGDGVVRGQLGVPALLIGGGTVEIQLNVIAERILGLPRG